MSIYKVGPNTYDGHTDTSNNLTREGVDSLEFNIPLGNKECVIAQEIRNIIPPELFEKESQTFGCPDCMDQCGYLVQILEYNGTVRTFDIDTQKGALPDFLKEFPAQVSDILKRLKPADK